MIDEEDIRTMFQKGGALCTCDDIGEGACPVHVRECQLQDTVNRLHNLTREYAEKLVEVRRESEGRLSRIQELTYMLPDDDELELLRRLYTRSKEDVNRSPDFHEKRALGRWLKRFAIAEGRD